MIVRGTLDDGAIVEVDVVNFNDFIQADGDSALFVVDVSTTDSKLMQVAKRDITFVDIVEI